MTTPSMAKPGETTDPPPPAVRLRPAYTAAAAVAAALSAQAWFQFAPGADIAQRLLDTRRGGGTPAGGDWLWSLYDFAGPSGPCTGQKITWIAMCVAMQLGGFVVIATLGMRGVRGTAPSRPAFARRWFPWVMSAVLLGAAGVELAGLYVDGMADVRLLRSSMPWAAIGLALMYGGLGTVVPALSLLRPIAAARRPVCLAARSRTAPPSSSRPPAGAPPPRVPEETWTS